MTERKHVNLLAIVGLSGTGKSSVAKYLGEQGIPRVSLATIIETAVEQAGLDFTPENERQIREKLRLDPAGDLAASEAIIEIDHLIQSGQHRIIIDGLASWETLKRLRHEFQGNINVVALVTRKNIRHRRVAERLDNPMTAVQTDQRDYDEIETLNKGGVIAIADHFIIDNGSLEQLYTQVDKLLREIEF